MPDMPKIRSRISPDPSFDSHPLYPKSMHNLSQSWSSVLSSKDSSTIWPIEMLILNNSNLTSFVPCQLVKHNEQQAVEGCFFPPFPTSSICSACGLCTWYTPSLTLISLELRPRTLSVIIIRPLPFCSIKLENHLGMLLTRDKLISVKLGQSYNHFAYPIRRLSMSHLS